MGRPCRTTKAVVHQVKLVLTPGEDDDLIRYLETLPARAKASAVKAAMRSGLTGTFVEDEDDAALYAALGDLVL
jgi:hypothetical protein